MRQLRSLKELMDYDLLAKDGEVGKLNEIFFNDQQWQVRYFVVHTGNWLFGREVLLPPALISEVSEKNRQIKVDLTREQIKQSPPADTKKPVSRHYEEQSFRYYNLPPYWQLESLHGITPPLPPLKLDDPPRQPEHPHLRSSSEVSGYRIQAEDGEFGQVADFILDDQNWSIRYLEIATRHWLPGKKVLVSPAWIQKIDWSQEEVRVDLAKELIENAPEYDPSKIISREYEIALYSHYGKDQ